MKIAILLATFNGVKYLSEQISSILAQTFTDFKLYISDDGSTDGTKEIIYEFQKKDSRIVVMPQHNPTKSACKHFIYMLQNVDSDLYFFSDQDDVWTNNHIELLLKEYSIISNKDSIPVLIHSDLMVVDKELRTIKDSFFAYSNLPLKQNKRLYFLQNNVTGCTVLLNNCLKEMVFLKGCVDMAPIPMHDNFFASIAAYFGEIRFVNQPLIKYRQHGENVLGAKNLNNLSYIVKTIKNPGKKDNRKLYIQFFLDYYAEQLSDQEKGILKEFIHINERNKILRCYFIIKYGFLKTGLKRKIYQLLTI